MTGDLAVLDDPLAKELLASQIPARLAYVSNGEPRVVPIWFEWTGTQVVMGSLATAPKARTITPGDVVALTIDSTEFPYRSLAIRGTIDVELLGTIAPEYTAASRRYLGPEQGQAWVEGFPTGTNMWRFTVTPTWANLQDFETRFPSAIVDAMGWSAPRGPSETNC